MSVGSRALAKARRGGQALRGRLKRIKDNKEAVTNGGLGLAAGYFGARYWGKTIAKRAKAGQSVTIPKIGITYGKAVGGGAALLGLFGQLGDERQNTIALVSGAMVLGADTGVEAYLEEAAGAAA